MIIILIILVLDDQNSHILMIKHRDSDILIIKYDDQDQNPDILGNGISDIRILMSRIIKCQTSDDQNNQNTSKHQY